MSEWCWLGRLVGAEVAASTAVAAQSPLLPTEQSYRDGGSPDGVETRRFGWEAGAHSSVNAHAARHRSADPSSDKPKQIVLLFREGQFDVVELYAAPDISTGHIQDGVEYFEALALPRRTLRLRHCAVTRSADDRRCFVVQESLFCKIAFETCHTVDVDFWINILTATDAARERLLRFPNTGFSPGYFIRPGRQLLPRSDRTSSFALGFANNNPNNNGGSSAANPNNNLTMSALMSSLTTGTGTGDAANNNNATGTFHFTRGPSHSRIPVRVTPSRRPNAQSVLTSPSPSRAQQPHLSQEQWQQRFAESFGRAALDEAERMELMQHPQYAMSLSQLGGGGERSRVGWGQASGGGGGGGGQERERSGGAGAGSGAGMAPAEFLASPPRGPEWSGGVKWLSVRASAGRQQQEQLQQSRQTEADSMANIFSTPARALFRESSPPSYSRAQSESKPSASASVSRNSNTGPPASRSAGSNVPPRPSWLSLDGGKSVSRGAGDSSFGDSQLGAADAASATAKWPPWKAGGDDAKAEAEALRRPLENSNQRQAAWLASKLASSALFALEVNKGADSHASRNGPTASPTYVRDSHPEQARHGSSSNNNNRSSPSGAGLASQYTRSGVPPSALGGLKQQDQVERERAARQLEELVGMSAAARLQHETSKSAEPWRPWTAGASKSPTSNKMNVDPDNATATATLAAQTVLAQLHLHGVLEKATTNLSTLSNDLERERERVRVLEEDIRRARDSTRMTSPELAAAHKLVVSAQKRVSELESKQRRMQLEAR